jgi:hypothetical protein
MAMPRLVEPEWLDELPAEDPRALRSRRDLKRVNALMANAGIVAGALPRDARRIAEIGAGDGAFALRLVKAMSPTVEGEITLLDRQDIAAPRTLEEFAGHGWKARAIQADVFDWLRDGATSDFDAIVANLFLHHFEPPRLTELLALAAAHARIFVACEPRRSAAALAGSRLLGLVGCNDVTRHDAVVSVHAGFCDRELSALWPGAGEWILEEGPRGLFSHFFTATRR